jgi:hypothetical protein
MSLLKEELNNIKYLFGYKPGKVISEQDGTPIELRRRMPQISQTFDEILNNPDNNPNDFSDEFEYADNMISWTVDELIYNNTDDSYYEDNRDNLVDFIKDTYGDFLFDRYYSDSSYNDEEDIDIDED